MQCSLPGCSTLDQSFRLGATTGALARAAATYAAESPSGRQPPSFQDININASVGMELGLIASYFIHQSVVEDREASNRPTEIYFGDLPPSPFVIPNNHNKRGGR